jgi:formate hydrogenlyase transcriptional activator
MQRYSWPGNIRELQNVIERGVILSDNDVFRLDPDVWRCRSLTEGSPKRISNGRIEIEAALKVSRGRVSGPQGAAVRLGVPAFTPESRIRAFSIDKLQFRANR